MISEPEGYQVKQLLVLHEELRDNHMGFWSPLMWAARNGRVTAAEEKVLARIITRVKTDFEKFCKQVG